MLLVAWENYGLTMTLKSSFVSIEWMVFVYTETNTLDTAQEYSFRVIPIILYSRHMDKLNIRNIQLGFHYGYVLLSHNAGSYL